MASVLNSHLDRAGFKVHPCEHWTVADLQQLQARLFREADGNLLAVYKGAADNRRQRFNSHDELQAHWAMLDQAAANSSELSMVRRDGLCHETVMWWVHHLPVAAQKVLTAEGLLIPSLPRHLHSKAMGGASDAKRTLLKEYTQQVSCQQCHTGNLSGDLTNATLPPPLPVDREHPGLERKRVCDFQAQPPCGPCDGLGGVRSGDGVEEFVPMPCEVLHGPEVPATTKGRYPSLAIVNLTGESRSPLAVIPDGKGVYPKLNARLALGWKDGVMRMRYDFNGVGTQLSVQTLQQAQRMDSGATAFWSSGHCACEASMAGNMHIRSFEADDPLDPLKLPPEQGGAAYLGRVRVTLDYNTSRPSGTVIADHFMKWAFHFLVDADSTSPSFGLPLRLYGPYGVLQVFDTWKLGDPTITEPDIWKMPAGCKVAAPVCSILEAKGIVEKAFVV